MLPIFGAMMPTLPTPKSICDRARLVAKHLGAEARDDHDPDLREYDDGLIQILLDGEYYLVVRVHHPDAADQWLDVLRVGEDQLVTYRPDLPLPNGTDWRDRLTELEALIPTNTKTQLFDQLRSIAGTPDADVMQHLIDLSNLERMGVAAASWVLQLMRQLTTADASHA